MKMFLSGILALFLVACAANPILFTSDDCILQSYNHKGQTYLAGVCVDEVGAINRERVQWDNNEGQIIRITYWHKVQRIVVEYQNESGGIWVGWSEKAGVSLGVIPPAAIEILEDNTSL